MNFLTEARRWIWAVLALVGVVLILGYCHQRREANEARSERDLAAATGEALDKVADQTPAIRQDQEEKQRAVDEIEGSDAKLPDGYGRELERLRRGERDKDSR